MDGRIVPKLYDGLFFFIGLKSPNFRELKKSFPSIIHSKSQPKIILVTSQPALSNDGHSRFFDNHRIRFAQHGGATDRNGLFIGYFLGFRHRQH